MAVLIRLETAEAGAVTVKAERQPPDTSAAREERTAEDM